MLLACFCRILAIIDGTFEQCADLVECIQFLVFYITAGCFIAAIDLELKRHPTKADY